MGFNIGTVGKVVPRPIRPFFRPVYNYLSTRESLRKYLTQTSAQIEITTYCNLQCTGCYRSIHDYSAKNKHMSLNDFKLYVEQLKPITDMCLYGVGEPTLHPDIRKMVEYTRTCGIDSTHFTTNALARDTDIYDELFDLGLTGIDVSVDSLDPREVEKLRPYTDVERLIRNIKYLTKGFPNNIKFTIVISKANLDTFELTVGRLVDLGAKHISCQPFDDLGSNSALCLSFREKRRFLEKFWKIRRDGVCFSASDCFGPIDHPCHCQSTVITVEGYLAPCPRRFDKDVFNLGNLRTTTLTKLLSSAEMRSLWAQMQEGIYPEFCKGCMCNHSEFNSLRWPEGDR